MKKIITVLIAVLLITSCSTTKQSMNADAKKYYTDNASSFEVFTLKNGIPVVLKKNESQKVLSLSIMIDGANALLDPQQSGIENITLAMMTRGSKYFAYDVIKEKMHKTKASIAGYTANGYSYFTLTCIDHYFSDLYQVFADSFLHPSFSENEFENIKTANLQNLQSLLNDPNSLVQYTAERAVYKNHPFETNIRPTYETIQTISLDDVASFHKTLMNAKRITIVASGNIDPAYLEERLTMYFAAIPVLDYESPVIPPVTISGDTEIIAHPSASGTGFLSKVYSFPQFTDKDYMPSVLACTIYSEILYNVVREKYGACYSIGNTQMLSKAPYMMLYVNSASDLQNLPYYIDEAQNIMSEGKIIDSKNTETNEFTFLTLEETLDGYKNSLINSLFSAYVTSSGQVLQIMGSIHLTGNKEAYLKLLERIDEVSTEDIMRVFNTYWMESPGRWFIVCGSEDVNSIPLSLYK